MRQTEPATASRDLSSTGLRPEVERGKGNAARPPLISAGGERQLELEGLGGKFEILNLTLIVKVPDVWFDKDLLPFGPVLSSVYVLNQRT